MNSPKPQIYDPERKPESKYFTRVPDDALEDPRLRLVTQAVFAQLLKRHWTNDPSLKVTQDEIAKRCRMTPRRLLPHLVKLEQCGYIIRERDLEKWGAPIQISLTYELRPSLELAADVPIARGSKCTHRTKTSGVVRTETSDAPMTKTSGPLFRETEEREMKEISSPPAPSDGEVAAAPLIDPDPPEYPDAPTSMFMVMPGEYTHPEIEARELWGDVWRAWKSPKLCYGFYEHQEWCTFRGWKHAVKTVIQRGIAPNSIRYLEKIAMDADLNGIRKDQPISRGSIGSVPYVPTAMQQKPPGTPLAPSSVPDAAGPLTAADDPVMTDLLRQLTRATRGKAKAAIVDEMERYSAAKENDRLRVPLESPPQPAGVRIRDLPQRPERNIP
jgi:hypothetical protein